MEHKTVMETPFILLLDNMNYEMFRQECSIILSRDMDSDSGQQILEMWMANNQKVTSN